MYLLLTSASRKLLALIKTASRPSLARCELTSQVFPEIVYILTHAPKLEREWVQAEDKSGNF